MAEIIKMPKMSDTMTEGTIAAWLKKVGDKVKSGDILAEVETDKATMELENYEDGILLYIGPKEKDSVPVDGILAIVGKEGEDISSLLSGQGGGAAPAAEAPKAEPAPAPAAASAPAPEAPKAAASPAPAPAAAAPAAPVAPGAPAAPANGKKATVVRMPKMSDTMTEGTIAAWLKNVGDKVKSGDILAEVETDKATMELENYEDGTLLYTGPKAGEAVAVDGILAIIGEEGADIQSLLGGQAGGTAAVAVSAEAPAPIAAAAPAAAPAPAENAPTKAAPAPAESAAPAQPAAAPATSGRILASPLAKSIAKEKGINLAQVVGSGDNGRIVQRDVENFQPGTAVAPAPTPAAAPVAAPVAAAAPIESASSPPLQLLSQPPQLRQPIPTPIRPCRRCVR